MAISDLDPSVPAYNGLAGLGDDELRLIKQALVDSFPALDGLISNAGAVGGAGDTDPPDAATYSKLFEDVRALQGGIGSGFIGEIKAYYGDVASIPAGWYLMDGTNGTQDFRGRMLIGDNQSPPAGLPTYDGAGTGGAIPGQQTTGSAGGHSHTTAGFALQMANLPGDLGSNILISQAAAGQADSHNDASSFARGAELPNANTAAPVTVSGANGTAHSHGNTGAVGSHTHTLSSSSLPPWGAVYLIMYTGV